MTITLVGCPGTLDPRAVPPPSSGGAGAGNTTGTAGAGNTSGAAGATSGTAGMGTAGTGAMACDMVKLISPAVAPSTVGYGCTLAGACHDAAGSAAGLSLLQADWPKLEGKLPSVIPPPPSFPSICALDATAKTIPYITSKSPTGDGLLLKKLAGAVCPPGVQMPSLGSHVSAADMPCFVQWATMLANM